MEISCYMRDSACRWHVVKIAKIFGVLLNNFEFYRIEEVVES